MANPQNIVHAASATYTQSGQTTSDFGLVVERIAVDINVTALGGSTNLSFVYERLGRDGIYYPVWSVSCPTVNTYSASIGHGLEVPKEPGNTARLRWVLSGAGATATFSFSIRGK